MTLQETESKLPASVGGPELAGAHHRDGALAGPSWHKSSWSSLLTLPYSPRPQRWVTSDQTTTREEVQPHLSPDNWIKALLSKALPTRARPSFPYHPPVPPIRMVEITAREQDIEKE